ncbi:MAG: hypothetical protein ACLFU0_12080 [Alphaproteobacteria bacterium]
MPVTEIAMTGAEPRGGAARDLAQPDAMRVEVNADAAGEGAVDDYRRRRAGRAGHGVGAPADIARRPTPDTRGAAPVASTVVSGLALARLAFSAMSLAVQHKLRDGSCWKG